MSRTPNDVARKPDTTASTTSPGSSQRKAATQGGAPAGASTGSGSRSRRRRGRGPRGPSWRLGTRRVRTNSSPRRCTPGRAGASRAPPRPGSRSGPGPLAGPGAPSRLRARPRRRGPGRGRRPWERQRPQPGALEPAGASLPVDSASRRTSRKRTRERAGRPAPRKSSAWSPIPGGVRPVAPATSKAPERSKAPSPKARTRAPKEPAPESAAIGPLRWPRHQARVSGRRPGGQDGVPVRRWRRPPAGRAPRRSQRPPGDGAPR